MNNNIKISICAGAIRTHLWSKFYTSLLSNQTSFEVIFVGDKESAFNAEHFKWIHSSTKPTQCYEIAFREAKGELINWTADDVLYSEHALDKAYAFYKSFNNDKIIVAFNCIENGSPTSHGHTIFDKNSPLMAPIGLINEELLKSIGGYDRRFICGQAENDITMQVYDLGGKVEICKDATVYIEHNKAHKGISKFRVDDGYDYHLHDRKVLEYKWLYENGRVIRNVGDKHQSFEDKDLLITTQNERGEWL